MARPVSFASGITALRFGGSNRQTIWANCMLPLAFNATGMESRIVCEVSRAAVGIDLSEADRIAKALLGKYEETLKSGQIPQGKSFRECYQLDLKPSHEYLDIWLKQKEELNELIKYNT